MKQNEPNPRLPVWEKMSPGELAQVLHALLKQHPDLKPEAEAIAVELVSSSSVEDTAEEVLYAVTALDLDSLNDRAGSHSWGYVEPTEADEAEGMIAVLDADRELRDLLSNQFLFLMAVRLAAKGKLPKSRVQLYESFLNKYLVGWEGCRPWRYRFLVNCLQGLAIAMTGSTKKRNSIPPQRAKEVLARFLGRSDAGEDVDDLLNDLHHTGLVEEEGAEIRLFQETFQEFLCARYFAEHGIEITDRMLSLSRELLVAQPAKRS